MFKSIWMRFLLLVYYFAVLLPSNIIASKVISPYEIEGVIIARSFRNGTNLLHEQARSFTISVSNECWVASSRYSYHKVHDPKLAKVAIASEINGVNPMQFSISNIWYRSGCDGKDTYTLTILGDYKAAAEAWVRPGVVPFNDDVSFITPIWIAYASSHALPIKAGSRLKPLWPLLQLEDLWYSDFDVKTTWTSLSKDSHLPKQLIQYHPGIRYAASRDPHVRTTTISKVEHSKPFTHGYKKFEYNLIEATNYNGILLPLRFEASVYIPNLKAADEPEVIQRTVYTGEMVLVRGVMSASDFKPNMHGTRPTIYDKRFKLLDTAPVVESRSANGMWPNSHDPNLRAQFETKLAWIEQERQSNARHKVSVRTIVYFLLLATTIGFGFFAFRFSKQHNQARNINENIKIQS